jgi:hypothetical protein
MCDTFAALRGSGGEGAMRSRRRTCVSAERLDG